MLNKRYIRHGRILLVLAIYSLVLAGSLWMALMLRFDFAIPANELRKIPMWLLWIVPFQLAVLLSLGHCASLLSYFALPDIRRLFYGLTIPSLLLLAAWHYAPLARWLPPRSVLIGNFVLAFGGLCASRFCLRLLRERYRTKHGKPRLKPRRVGIIGAGDAGAALARELMSKGGLGMNVIAFFDDNPSKWRSRLHNVPVVGAPELLANPRAFSDMDEVAIALPSAPTRRIKEIVKMLQEANRKFTTVPSLAQLASGRVSVSNLRPVVIEDLLGRAPVRLDEAEIQHCLHQQVVMVTGAGGSIGSELCRQIIQFHPQRLLLLDQSEVQLFGIEQELMESRSEPKITSLVGDVTDEPRMRQIFNQNRPQVIFHAAAHKHVPMMESQPSEAIKNNALGTAHLAQLALEYGAARFVMISTDKAINPTSVMGATKRLAELFVQSLSTSVRDRTKFMAVRFGNVLGSSGSVIPTFKRQIAAGGPVKVTHPDMERYFMTIPEAVNLVLQSGALGSGGEIFVLDMGKPVRIAELAKHLIELSGFKPDEDIEIEFVGLRPGEKLFEEIQHKAENLAPTNHPKILRFVSDPLPFDNILEYFGQLRNCLYDLEPRDLKLFLKAIVPEYTPYFEPDKTASEVERFPGWSAFPRESFILNPGATLVGEGA